MEQTMDARLDYLQQIIDCLGSMNAECCDRILTLEEENHRLREEVPARAALMVQLDRIEESIGMVQKQTEAPAVSPPEPVREAAEAPAEALPDEGDTLHVRERYGRDFMTMTPAERERLTSDMMTYINRLESKVRRLEAELKA